MRDAVKEKKEIKYENNYTSELSCLETCLMKGFFSSLSFSVALFVSSFEAIPDNERKNRSVDRNHFTFDAIYNNEFVQL